MTTTMQPTSYNEMIKTAIIASMTAQNPEYNITIKDARQLQTFLVSIGLAPASVEGNPISAGPVTVQPLTTDELVEQGIAQDVPLYIVAKFAGRPEGLALGMMRRKFADGFQVSDFLELFSDVYPTGRNQFNQSAYDVLLSTAIVADAIKTALSKLAKQLPK